MKLESNFFAFRWKGKNRLGQVVKGKASAENISSLASILKKQGIISLHIRPILSLNRCLKILKQALARINNKPKSIEILFMIKELSILLSAHIPLLQALKAIQPNLSTAFKPIIQDCITQIQLGHTLFSAFQRYLHIFNSLFCCWIEAGEHAGTLNIVLEYWVSYQEKSETIRKKVQKALAYPIFILVISLSITIILCAGVLPVFEKLFHQVNAELPKITKYVMMFAKTFKSCGVPLLTTLTLGISGVWFFRNHLIKSLPKLMYNLDFILLRIPILGKIMQEAAFARLSRAMSIMLSVGFPLSEALEWASQVMNNRVLTAMILRLKDAVVSGVLLNQAISACPHINRFVPLLLKQMIAVGETSGTLGKVLAQIADFYEKKVFNQVENMSHFIEPIIMIFLGFLIGGFILAMYLPIFQLGALF